MRVRQREGEDAWKGVVILGNDRESLLVTDVS